MFSEIFPKLRFANTNANTKSLIWESPKTPDGIDKKKVHLSQSI